MNKISIMFSPGSYGTYLAWAIYSYSSLNRFPIRLPFTETGSAHDFRNSIGSTFVSAGHLGSNSTPCVLIKPSHLIDYINNQNLKQSNLSQIDFVSEYYSPPWARQVCRVWEKRELYSMFLPGLFIDTTTKYSKIESRISIESDDILLHPVETLDKIFDKLGLARIVESEVIVANHNLYLGLQRYAFHHVNLDQIVEDTIDDVDCIFPVLTFHDEAYIQHKLRIAGFEIRCFDLDVFPSSTTRLHDLLIKVAGE